MNTQLDLFNTNTEHLPDYVPLVIPDDTTIIQALIEHGYLDDKEETPDAAEKWLAKTYNHKLNMYDYSQKELDNYEKEVTSAFIAVRDLLWESILQCMGDIDDIIYGTIRNNVENIAYWYNINAPFHNRKNISYRDFKMIFNEK